MQQFNQQHDKAHNEKQSGHLSLVNRGFAHAFKEHTCENRWFILSILLHSIYKFQDFTVLGEIVFEKLIFQKIHTQ